MKTTPNTKPLKRLAVINRAVLQESTFEDYEIEYVDISNVTGMGRILGTEKMPFGKAPSRARRLVRNGDTIVSTVRTYLRAITTIQDPPPNLVVSTGFATLTPGLEIDGGYFAYLAQTEHFIHEVVSRSTGVSYPAITPTELGNIHISYPPLPLQRRIAAYLDRETARIDALVAEKEALLRLLEEKRASLISHAVTRGLNPKAKLKPSGIPWLGDVPEHWEVKKIKNVATFNDDVLPECFDDDEEIQYVDIGSVSLEKGVEHTELIRFGNAPSRARRKCRHGDVIVSTVRTYLKAIAPIIDPDPNFVVSTGFAVIRPGCQLIPSFAKYSLQSGFFVTEVISRSTGVSYPAINATEMAEIPITMPPVDEQKMIGERLDAETTRIDSLVADLQTSFHLLCEKRTSLISSAVTGEMAVD